MTININLLAKRKYQLKYQLIRAFVITLILPTFFMQITTHIITRVIMDKKINALVSDNLVKNKQNIDLLFKNYTTLVGAVSSDYQLINNLHSINKTNENSVVKNKVKEIKEQLYLTAFAYSEIQSITVVTRDYGSIPYYKKNLELSTRSYKSICEEAKKVATTIGGVLPDSGVNKDGASIYIARKIMDLNTLEYLGTVIVCIDPKPIYDLSYNHEASAYSTSLIISPKKQIIISRHKSDMGQYVSQDQINQVASNKIKYHSMPLRYFQWDLVYMVDQTLVMKELTGLGYIILFVSIVFLIVMIVSIIGVSNRFTKTIPKLIKAMKEVQNGNFNIKVPISSNNEIGDIEKTFNYMTSRIDVLMEENSSQYEKLIVATKRKNEAEISLMLSNLAKILRYTIRNINRVVTVKDEIDWLSQYLYLQKQRFVTVFDYQIVAGVEVYKCKIYKLLLQPLIENAIIHGFEGYENGGLLKIIFEIVDNHFIKVQIRDWIVNPY